MANTQRANPGDRFQVPPSVTKWHMTRRLWRGRGSRPDSSDSADSLAQAFGLDTPKPPAGDKPKGSAGGKPTS